MPSFGQFELFEPIRIAAMETWLAREGNSERPLLLHKFSKESGIRERLLTMKPNDLIMLLRAGEENGVCFVVTYDTPELRDFGHWVDERAPVPVGPAMAEPTTPIEVTTATDSEPAEFSRMFQSPVSSPAPSQPQPSPSSVKAANEPGEFTGFFANPQTPSALPEQLNNTSAEEPETRITQEPGEFTRQFGAPTLTPAIGGQPSRPPAPVSELSVSKPAAARRNYVPLILILSVLALAAFALIFYLLVRR